MTLADEFDLKPEESSGDTIDILSDQVCMPEFMRSVLSLDEIPVIQYEDKFTGEILEDCLKAGHVGATYIRLGKDRNVLMCLTTEDKIYVINMMLRHDVEFLKQLLQLQDIRIYIFGGPNVVDRIDSKFGLNLTSLFDLNTFDTFLALRRCQLQNSKKDEKFNLKLAYEFGLRLRNRIELQRYWLKINLPNPNLKREKKETEAIRRDLESVQAKNVIRYRAFATRALALAMDDRFDADQHQDTDYLYSFAVEVDGEKYSEYANRTDKHDYVIVVNFINDCRGE